MPPTPARPCWCGIFPSLSPAPLLVEVPMCRKVAIQVGGDIAPHAPPPSLDVAASTISPPFSRVWPAKAVAGWRNRPTLPKRDALAAYCGTRSRHHGRSGVPRPCPTSRQGGVGARGSSGGPGRRRGVEAQSGQLAGPRRAGGNVHVTLPPVEVEWTQEQCGLWNTREYTGQRPYLATKPSIHHLFRLSTPQSREITIRLFPKSCFYPHTRTPQA